MVIAEVQDDLNCIVRKLQEEYDAVELTINITSEKPEYSGQRSQRKFTTK